MSSLRVVNFGMGSILQAMMVEQIMFNFQYKEGVPQYGYDTSGNILGQIMKSYTFFENIKSRGI